MEKYGYTRMEALRKFIFSSTHRVLEDIDNGLYSFGCHGIFDIWECEIVTGDPRNSLYTLWIMILSNIDHYASYKK